MTLTVVAGEGVGERLHDPELRAAARRRGRSHVIELEGRTVLADVTAPPPRLFVYGAVDTAEALCRAAKLLGWRTVVADARASFATPERIPSADELLVALARRGARAGAAGPRHCGRRPHARRQVRPAADPRRARRRRLLRRLDRLAAQPGAAARPPARGGRGRRRTRPDLRAVRVSTSARTRPPRRRSRSSPRSSRCARDGPAGGSGDAKTAFTPSRSRSAG